jgi:hypothetical protein
MDELHGDETKTYHRVTMIVAVEHYQPVCQDIVEKFSASDYMDFLQTGYADEAHIIDWTEEMLDLIPKHESDANRSDALKFRKASQHADFVEWFAANVANS